MPLIFRIYIHLQKVCEFAQILTGKNQTRTENQMSKDISVNQL